VFLLFAFSYAIKGDGEVASNMVMIFGKAEQNLF
jgi:hypothetical protein